MLVSLGPVQDFIASARKCQDLWFGSWMLSTLARATSIAMRNQCGAESLVFPATVDGNGESEAPAVANKILCLVPDGQQAARVAEIGRLAMNSELLAMAADAFDRVRDRGRNWFNRRVALDQVRAMMEFQWVAVPYEAPGDYEGARRRAEALLAERKNTRTWGPVTWGGQVPKSSIDGLRESVLDEALFSNVRQGRLTADAAREDYFVNTAERLCGVGMLKRVGAEVDDYGNRRRPCFHSTSHVAAAPLLARMERSGQRAVEAFARYVNELDRIGVRLQRFRIAEPWGGLVELAHPWEEGNPLHRISRAFPHADRGLDGYLLFEDRLSSILEEESTCPDAQLRDAPRVAARSLQAFMRDLGVASPPAYYALLQADGDNMGRAIDRLATLEGHKALGAALDRFSLRAGEIVRGHAGSLIFSGGDDVLALVPLHTAIQCSRALHDAFGELVGVEGLENGPTLSVGLAIAHHMEDMAEVRDLARKAEKLAKRYAGPEGEKNALAVVVSKRSGGTLRVVGSWDEALPLDRRVLQWARLFHEERLPDKAAFDLESETAGLLGSGQAVGDGMSEVIDALARRVLLRKKGRHGAEQVEAQVRELLVSRLNVPDVAQGVRHLSQELQASRVVLDGLEAAWGEVNR